MNGWAGENFSQTLTINERRDEWTDRLTERSIYTAMNFIQSCARDLKEEYERLQAINVWDIDSVIEYDLLMKQIRDQERGADKGDYIKHHFGRIFPIVVEKNSFQSLFKQN